MKEDTRIALLEQSIGHINETLVRFEKRFDNIDKKFEFVDKKFELLENKMEQGFRELRSEGRTHFRWMMGFIIILMGSPIISQIINSITEHLK